MDDGGRANGSSITVEAKVAGQRRPAIDGWRVPLPAPPAGESHGAGDALTLRDLLATVVRQDVLAFRQRREERRLARVLSPQAIERGAAQGKIDMGGLREVDADEVDEDAAVAVALLGFEVGLYFVFLDGQQCMRLDEEVRPHAESVLQFIRLVALAGGEA